MRKPYGGICGYYSNGTNGWNLSRGGTAPGWGDVSRMAANLGEFLDTMVACEGAGGWPVKVSLFIGRKCVGELWG